MQTGAGAKGGGIWPAAFVVALLLAAGLALRALTLAPRPPLFLDSDDAMRFTVVQDLLGGQDWHDMVQHRLDTPYGAQLHWSRLVDLPLAALTLLLEPLAGDGAAEAAAFLWPLLLLLPLVGLCAALSVALAGREGLLAGLLLPAFSVIVPTEFAPGRIDHHAVVILVCLGLLYCCIAAPRRRGVALWAGVCAATALAIAVESLPAVIAAICGMGLAWVLAAEHAGMLRRFGLGLAGAAIVNALIALPPERWLDPACDAFSAVYIVAALGTGVLFVVLPLLPLRQPPARLAAGVVAGGLLGCGLLLAFPHCLEGPYAALDPWLAARWIGHVREAATLWQSLVATPAFTIGALVPVLLACAVVLYRLRTAPASERSAWLIYGLFLAFALTVMAVQIRGARLAVLLAVPAGAWLIAAARRRYLERRGALGAAGLLGSWLGFSGVAVAAAVALALPGSGAGASTEAAARPRACLMEEAFAGLAALPPARIMSFVDLGAHILARTPHAVVGAPYHRNQDGIRDTLRFFNLPLEEMRGVLEARGIELVVVCPFMPEARGFADAAPGSFLRLLEKGELPEWLRERELGETPLRAFEVLVR